jgi:hypothetical protein
MEVTPFSGGPKGRAPPFGRQLKVKFVFIKTN